MTNSVDPLEVSELPPLLAATVRTARLAVFAHPSHQLLPWHRKAIYDALLQASPIHGARARGLLACQTARYVLPVWRLAYSDDPIADETLAMAEAVVTGQATIEQAEVVRVRAWEHFEQLGSTPVDSRHFRAGAASELALREVLGIGPFADITISLEMTDDDLDQWSNDAAALAAAAYAGRAGSDAEVLDSRKAFWLWWLDTAVPTAWRTAARR